MTPEAADLTVHPRRPARVICQTLIGLVAIYFILGTTAAFALGEVSKGINGFSLILVFTGVYRLVCVADVREVRFPSSTALTPEARRWAGRTFGMFWCGLIGMLSVGFVRSLRGSLDGGENWVTRLSTVDSLNAGTILLLLVVVLLAFLAERHRADGDAFRWPRYPNYAADEVVYTPRGVRYRRGAMGLLRALVVLGALSLAYSALKGTI